MLADMTHKLKAQTMSRKYHFRYSINASTLSIHVRARRRIFQGEEISVQYLNALMGTQARRKKIKEEWYC